MNGCPQHREQLALLAAGVLEVGPAGALRRHVRDCPSCRQRFRELSRICDAHTSAAGELPWSEPPANFHPRLMQRIRASEPAANRAGAGPLPRLLSTWRWPLVLASGALLLFVVFNNPRSRVGIPLAPASFPSAQVGQAPSADSPTTLLAYRRAANESAEALDALLALNSQGTEASPPTTTAFTRDLSAVSDD